MNFTRRSAIKAIAGSFALPTLSPIASVFAQSNSDWKTYEITTIVNLDAPDQAAQAWIPLPLVKDTDYFKTVSIKTEFPVTAKGKSKVVETPDKQARMAHIQWDKSSGERVAKVVTVISTRERFNQLSGAPNPTLKLSPAEQKFWTKGTAMLPTDGIVKAKALEITKNLPSNASDIDKAKAVYDWVVENTQRNPKTRGCGPGDVKYMLENNELNGKCADLNALYVALTRSLGVPARDVYGIRVADSARGYKSLGKADNITKAQHCRAEFYANGYGWVAVDPADVRKVILEESGGLAENDPKVLAARQYLFGSWEMNWMAYNYEHDVVLPGSKLGKAGAVSFLMYPQAEAKDGRFDSLDPDNFKYTITSKLVS